MKKKLKVCLLSGLAAITCMTSAIAVASRVEADSKTEEIATQAETVRTEKISVNSLFSGSKGVTLTANQDTPSYVMNSPRNGVLVNSVEGGTVEYLQTINLNDNTKEDLLAEIQITPATTANYEMDQIVLRFEDAVNPKIFFEVSLHRYTYGKGGIDDKVFSTVTVTTNTIGSYKGWSYKVEEIGKEVGDDGEEKPIYKKTYKVANEQDVRHGTGVFVPFYGAANKRTYRDASLKLFYDNESKTIYAGPVIDDSGEIRKDGLSEGPYDKVKVLDLDSYTDMGTNQANLWTGWTNGTVNVSVSTNGVASSARYMILGIDNQTFDGELLNDVTPPVLTVDVDESNLPYGVVGKQYPFFHATAVDAMYGEDTYIMTEVRKGNEILQSTQKGFIPTQAGEYTLRYYAYDFVGNCFTKEYSIPVYEQAKPTAVSLNEMSLLSGALALEEQETVYSVERYQDVVLPVMDISGTSGHADCTIDVTFNGKKIQVRDNVFKAVYEGVYLVKYIFTDTLDNAYVYTYRIQSTYSGKAAIEEPSINAYMLHGSTYKLPKVESSLYNAYGGKGNATTSIKVYDNGTNAVLAEYDGTMDVAFTPNMPSGGSLKIVYQAANGTVTHSIEKLVTVLKNDKLFDRFVVYGDITPTVKDYETELVTSEEGSGFAIVNPVLYEGFALTVGVPAAKNNFSSLDFYLVDTENSMQAVSLSVVKNPSTEEMKSDVLVNGKKIGECGGNFYETASADFIFEFKNGNEVYDNNGDKIGNISETVYGAPFTGFDSKFVNVTVTLRGVSGESAIVIKNFNNQMVGKFSSSEDYTKPTVTTTGEITLKTEIGGTLEIPEFYAFDVFESYLELQVVLEKETQVEGKKGEAPTTVREKILEQTFAFNQTEHLTYKPYEEGKYLLTVTCKDSAGNATVYNGGVVMMVGDYSPPVIKVDGTIAEWATVGKKITLPKAKAMDVVDGEIDVVAYVVNPNASITKIEGKTFTPNGKGTYMIFFYAEDSSGNYAMSDYYTVYVQ